MLALPGAVIAANAAVQRALFSLLELYIIILLARAVMSWFPVTPGTPLESVVRILERLTEPVLRPIRRLLPPLRAGGMAIDLSIIIAIIGLQIIGPIVISYL